MTTFNYILRLREVLEKREQKSFLFNCLFYDYTITGIYFVEADTLLISFPSIKVAWQSYLSKEKHLNSFLPKDIYQKIKPILKIHTNYKPEPIYTTIDNYFKLVSENELIEATKNQIQEIFSQTISTDRKYDKDCDKPFFLGWRRNPKDSTPSNENIEKTARTFGKAVKEICKTNKISSRWTHKLTERTFDFLNKIDEQEIINGIEF